MQDKVTYEYAIIRLVPKVEREEFFNVGVIVFAKSPKFLEMKFKIDDQKLNAFGCDIGKVILTQYLESWEAICKGNKESGTIGTFDLPSRFRWLVAARSTIIQSSKTHPGLTNDPEKELEDLFERFVL